MSSKSVISAPLGAYLLQLQKNPLQTKCFTAATLSALSEFLASYIAKSKDPKTGSYYSSRVPKMALYGFFVSAPLQHVLVNALQKAFANKKGVFWKLAQILASNLLITPITSSAFIASMAVITGARSIDSVIRALKTSLPAIIKSSWVTSPFVLAFAQSFIPEQLWVPFFSFCYFFLGTYNNSLVKKKQIAARKAAEEDKKLE